jgi:hypothetical protein
MRKKLELRNNLQNLLTNIILSLNQTTIRRIESIIITKIIKKETPVGFYTYWDLLL